MSKTDIMIPILLGWLMGLAFLRLLDALVRYWGVPS